jgi:hypothetical protein
MPEEFINYIWENSLFITDNIKTTDGESLKIISTGRRNYNSGPDFFNARININGTIWAGNVEVHRRASDWHRHKHNNDKAYDNVILHVVEYADKKINRSNGTAIATLKIKCPDEYKSNYAQLLSARTWIACEEQLKHIDPLFLKLGFHRLMTERLEKKTSEILSVMNKNQNDWNETFYQILARKFGFKVNSTPFELLARSVPMKILSRHYNNIFQLEALLFGASGLLNEELWGDDYSQDLRKEFGFLGRKYRITPVEYHLWKFMRIRPVNFPTIRISQLAGLIYRYQGLFSKIVSAENINDLQKLFRVSASGYWDSHYRLNRKSAHTYEKQLGSSSIQSIIINVVVPLIFVYGEQQNIPGLKNRALNYLEELPPENNSVTAKWRKAGIECRSAFESQSLLQLKTMYCDKKRCLNCYIGNKLIREGMFG